MPALAAKIEVGRCQRLSMFRDVRMFPCARIVVTLLVFDILGVSPPMRTLLNFAVGLKVRGGGSINGSNDCYCSEPSFEALVVSLDSPRTRESDPDQHAKRVQSVAYACRGSLPTTVIPRENASSSGRARSTALSVPAATIHSRPSLASLAVPNTSAPTKSMSRFACSTVSLSARVVLMVPHKI